MFHNVKMPKKWPEVIKVTPGSKEKVIYKYVYDEAHHCPRRVPNGTIDLQEYIQQSADDVDFKAIGKMLVDTRDNVVDHFNLNGEEMDITRVPRNIHEYEALHNKMKASFEGLDPDVKRLFQDDFDLFRSAWTNGSIEHILNTASKAADVPVTSESPSTASNAEGGTD